MAALGEDLLGTVNKLQDLVFNTIGNDSLDLPQIVSWNTGPGTSENVSSHVIGRRWLAVVWKIFSARKYCW